MPLRPGVRLGPYEILGSLGAGGMGEVYRARDPRLGRDVAIKVLPDALRTDPDRLRRFEQEARAASALNHPNLLVVLDVGTHDGVPYVVSELLEGETLRERLRVGGLTPTKSVAYAVQIALGLAAAHEKGITHRDLKPENLFLTRDGRVKILDFGLAKLREPAAGGEGTSEVQTLSHGTEPGAILGTVGYMSPEQVRGFPADHRSDIFSFGAVLYEMLSKRRAFAGESSPEVLTAILKEDPPELSSSERNLPPALGRIVRRCLEKRPEDRFHSAHDLGLALEAVTGQTGSEPRVEALRTTGRFVGRAITLAALALAASVAFVSGRRAAYFAPPIFHRLTFHRGGIFNARFAPDRVSVIYNGKWENDDHLQLYSQSLDAIEGRSLGLPGLELMAVAPGQMALRDSEDVEETLSRMPLEGGGLRKVVDRVACADWSPNGATLAVARFGPGRKWIEFPIGKTVWESTVGGVDGLRVSPDGQRVAFMDRPLPTDTRAAISVVDQAGRKTTLSTGWTDVSGLAWSPDGREVWFTAVRAGTAPSLHAVSLTGQERLVLSAGAQLGLMDVSRDGRALLAETEQRRELRGAPDGVHERSFSWLDRTSLGDLSADGKSLLFSDIGDAGDGILGGALYLWNLADPMPTRLGDGFGLGLSPDGAWALVNLRTPTGLGQLNLVPTGVGETRLLARGTLQAIETACWFPDGRRIIVLGNEAGRRRRLFIQEVPDGLPQAFTPEGTSYGLLPIASSRVSPDGRFVAALRTDGPSADYALFPTAGGAAIPIPGIGDHDPLRWSGDGRFLFVWGGWGSMPARIERLDLRTGRKQPWKELRPPDSTGVAGINVVRLAPDGGAYFYHYDRRLSNLYLVEGLR